MHALSEHRGFDSNDVMHPSVPVVMPVGFARPGCLLALVMVAGASQAAQVVINGPAGSGEFGRTVTTLPNGNIVVTDPGFDAPGPIANVGAVYLYLPDGSLISTLRGSRFNDRVGHGGVVVLTNGNFVVSSPDWSNVAIASAGAVTFGLGTSGVAGTVSPTNSLVGSTAFDRVGSVGVTALTNGNYVVRSPGWDNGAIADAGAVTFGLGTHGITGAVSSANSLVGSTASDRVGGSDFLGISGITTLPNGSYVVSSPRWSNGSAVDAGAVTFGSGTVGITGAVSPANSLVGSTTGDFVGSFDTIALINSNYVVRSPNWNNGAILDAGAVTFGSGSIGVAGAVSATNSLVGSTASDSVGLSGVTPLANGNYVVSIPDWDNGVITDVGAVTFGSGTVGITGVVSSVNSLVGSTASDRVGGFGVTALASGNYAVSSRLWDHGAIVDAGAVTFGSGVSGITGLVSAANSLVGTAASDSVGTVTALGNGNYVVATPGWNNGQTPDVGAVTFGSGTSGITGSVSLINSLVGSTAFDQVGSPRVTALTNGNYVVRSDEWNNGATASVGAVTFGSGTSGITGTVSMANSLIGSTPGDRVGAAGVTGLPNGNFVVRSSLWDNGATVDVGAATFGSGISGITGVVSATNSLVGVTANDNVGIGSFGVIALSNGNYLVHSGNWDNGAVVDAGAVTFGSGLIGVAGAVSPLNSLVGSTESDFVGSSGVIALPNGKYVVSSLGWDNGSIVNAGAVTLGLSSGGVVGAVTSTHSVLGVAQISGGSESFSYDPARNQLSVGQPRSNRVVLHRTGIATEISIVSSTPDPSNGGEPVTFIATITAAPNAPTDGKVTFTASSGETCVDTTPTSTSATTADWSCPITFTANGVSSVVAEYTGSIMHAYSGSAPELHTTIVEPPLFADGFEGP